MARAQVIGRGRALRKRELHELGWKAVVAQLGVANATGFIMELGEGERDYAKLRGRLCAKKSLDELYAQIRRIPGHRGQPVSGPRWSISGNTQT
jgi:hypothetical protein